MIREAKGAIDIHSIRERGPAGLFEGDFDQSFNDSHVIAEFDSVHGMGLPAGDAIYRRALADKIVQNLPFLLRMEMSQNILPSLGQSDSRHEGIACPV